MPNRPEVTLRPLRPGELSEDHDPDSEFDDFGPRAGYTEPPSCQLDDDFGTLAVVVDDEVAGIVSWHWVRWGPTEGSRNPMIGIWLQSSARGHGVGTAAQRLLVDLVFRHTAINRVEAHTDGANHAEQRALEKVGFAQEGVIRGAQWRDGAHHDGILYSMLRSEWSASTAFTASATTPAHPATS